MTEDEIKADLPPGWELMKLRKDGDIEIVDDRLNTVVAGKDWSWVRQRALSLTLSHRDGR